jgi:hypothetical protein
MPVVPKFQMYECGERVPTQFQVKGGAVEYPGIHICPRGHALPTILDVKPGEETIGTADVLAQEGGKNGRSLDQIVARHAAARSERRIATKAP